MKTYNIEKCPICKHKLKAEKLWDGVKVYCECGYEDIR